MDYSKNKKFGGNKGGFRGGEKRYGGGGNRDSRTHGMHSAVCSNCGKTCEVPFRPTGEKPVYCRDCFASQGDFDNSKRESFGNKERGGNSNFSQKPSFTPHQAPVENKSSNDEIKKQLESLNSKLERLISVVENLGKKESKPEIKMAPEIKKAPVKIPAKEVKKPIKKSSVSKKK